MAKKPKRRQQKKNTKTTQNKKMMSTGLSKKQIKQLTPSERKKTVKKIETTESRNLKRQQNRQLFEKYNVKGKYIINGKEYTPSRMLDFGPDKIKEVIKETQRREKEALKEIEREKNRRYRQNTQNKKIEMLMSAGFDYEQAYKNRNKIYADISDLMFLGDRNVYTAKAYFSLRWSDNTGESQMALATADNNKLSTSQMIKKIKEKVSKIKKDDSNDFKGVPYIIVEEDKNILNEQIYESYIRGYTDKMTNESEQILYTNQWTLRGFANVMYNVLCKTSDNLKLSSYYEFEDYARNYLPEIYKQIF